METHARLRVTGQLVLGIVIATLGLLFTLDNLGVLEAREYLRFWPIVLVGVGVVQIMHAETPARMLAGGIWILVGGAWFGRALGLLPENVRDYWPLLLILLGGYVVWQSFQPQATMRSRIDGGPPGPVVSAIAVMSGFNRRVPSEFRGAELTAFMGGGKLDLREATLVGGEAVVNVFALMGGFEILVPETWSVRTEVIPFMGGVDDKTKPPSGPAPQLVLRGFVMMGGVEIKNWERRDR